MIRRTLGIALAAGLLGAAEAGATRAQGGAGLLEALEQAPAAAVVEVLGVERLDAHGYRARVRVESALIGPVSPGAELALGWEELAPSRAPRFARGDRVLVALERLPGASIWLERIPEPELRSKTLAPARGGEAFLRSPGTGTVDVLRHYLLLEPKARRGPSGAGQLAALAAGAELVLALSAVERLDQVQALDAALGPRGGERLVSALLRPDATPALQDAVLALVATQELESLRAPLEARRAVSDPPPALVLSALAALDGGLPADQADRLLGSDASPAHRRVGARWAQGPEATELLARVARDDPDPAVRSRALARLGEIGGAEAAGRVAVGLYDPVPEVRVAAATSLGALGSPAVPELRAVVEYGSREAAQAAVAGLMLTGTAAGSDALGEIAASHPDPSVRKLARVALGGELGHQH